MSRKRLQTIIPIVLALLVALIIGNSLTAVEPIVPGQRVLEFGVFALLTAFALVLSVPLSKGELSIAHAIGMMAFLSLDASAAPVMTIAIFLGGLSGGILLTQLEHHPAGRERERAEWRTVIFITAQVTISFFVASKVYIDIFHAPLPLDTLNGQQDLFFASVPLLAYAFIYVVLYFVIFVLQIETDTRRSRSLLEENQLVLAIILLLPIPFSVIGANVARRDESIIFFTTTTIGAGLIIFGLYILNRTQQQLRRQLDEMCSISVATQAMRGNLNLDSLLRTTYVQVSQLVDTENFSVALHSDDKRGLTFPLVIQHGEERNTDEYDAHPPDGPLIQHVIKIQAPLLIKDNVQDKIKVLGMRPSKDELRSWLGVPIIAGEETLGAIVVQSYDKRSFDENDLRLLNIVVTSVSIAIENARLYQQKSTRAEQLATLNQVTSLLTGTLASREILNVIVSSASTISEADAVAIYLNDDTNNSKLKLVLSAGLSELFINTNPQPLMKTRDLSAGESYAKPQSLVIPNIDDPSAATADAHAMLHAEGKFALIETPLSVGGQYLGVLSLYFDTPQAFASEQLDMIQAFATQAAQAIQNARTFTSTDEALERRVEQLHSLAAMGRLLTATSETDRIYNLVLTFATDATKAERGMVIVQDKEHLNVAVQRGYPADIAENPETFLQGLAGRTLRSGQAFRTTDARLETGYLPHVPTTRSLLIVPLLRQRNVLGIILLESDTPALFSEGDSQFVTQLANQAVIALENTDLFRRIREAHDNMQTILHAMEEGIILIGGEHQVILANPRVNLIGLSHRRLANAVLEDLLEDTQLHFAQRLGFKNKAHFQQLIDDYERADPTWSLYRYTHSYEVQQNRATTRFVQRQVIPVWDSQSQIAGLLLIFYDKTEERELALARESLSQMIVHDLRSPLTSVTTSLRLLDELVPKDADFYPIVDKTTNTSRRAIRKVLNRVDSLLDVSKMESGEINLDREPTSIAGLADNVRSELKPLADELGIRIRLDMAEDLPLLDIDADKVERMLLNLVDNALKYSPEDTLVTICAEKSSDQEVRLDVADQGPGIPDEHKQRLFDRFAQIEGRKSVRRGVGLGLTFCRLVTEAHGGRIWVEDKQGGGSIFSVTLPVLQVSEVLD